MSTATLPRSSLYFTQKPLATLPTTRMSFAKEKGGDGAEQNVLRIEGMPVFRSGTFRDSMGWQNTWESLHMKEMVSHFQHLRDTGIFTDVPVRAGHPSASIFGGGNPVMELIGYIKDLRTETHASPIDGKEYEYLLADYDILDADAQVKINSGLWRNRSAEIGTYVTNDEAEYAPTFMGVAYVDMPAVEGLNIFSKGDANSQYSIMMEESAMPMPTPQPPTGEKKDDDKGVTPPAAQPFAFTINGTQTTDFAAVQAYIAGIETTNTELANFRTQTLESQRVDFVKGLAGENKIGANQIDEFTEFAKGLTDEQYEKWTATFGKAQPQSLFQNHGSETPAGANPDDKSGQDAQADPLAVPKGVLVALHRANVPVDKIKRSAQYSQVVTAEKGFDLAAFLRSAK